MLVMSFITEFHIVFFYLFIKHILSFLMARCFYDKLCNFSSLFLGLLGYFQTTALLWWGCTPPLGLVQVWKIISPHQSIVQAWIFLCMTRTLVRMNGNFFKFFSLLKISRKSIKLYFRWFDTNKIGLKKSEINRRIIFPK